MTKFLRTCIIYVSTEEKTKMTRDEILTEMWDLEEKFGFETLYHALCAYLSVDDLVHFTADFKRFWVEDEQ